MRVPCKCKRCTWKWTSRIEGGPKTCPGCHSPNWRTQSNNGNTKVKMACSICKKRFRQGQTVFRFQEGIIDNGAFRPAGKESQGLYCENCAPAEDILPF